MIFKFRTLTAENKAFLRDYEIDSDSSFTDLHRLIQHNLGFDENQLASFFMADEGWNKGLEFTLLDMNNEDGPVAVPMDTVRIGDMLSNRKDRLLYVYDIFTDQHLFLELIDIFEPKEGVEYPCCSASVGDAPLQLAADSVDFSEECVDNLDEMDELEDEFGDGVDPDELSDLDFNEEGPF